MIKPLQTFNFFLIEDMWKDVDGHVLADVLAMYDLVIDERTQFARIYDYHRWILFYFRASAGKISLTLWRIPRQ